MGIFIDISDQWQIADNALATLESTAFAADDDAANDAAGEQRKRNDQAYFLYLFTRFEQAVTNAAKVVVLNRSNGIAWQDSRIWDAWKSIVIRDEKNMHFMSKVEVLIDKSLNDYGVIKSYYGGRNNIGHGGIFTEQFVIPEVAIYIENMVNSFPNT